MIELVINKATPSLNEFNKKHWTVYHKAKTQWSWMLTAALAGKYATPASGKRRLTVERHGSRMLDTDNLYGGLKVLIDALKKKRLIVDDSPDHLELRAEQLPLIKGEEPYTHLTLEDL